MIVRINQFQAAHAERCSGWPQQGPQAALACNWPADTRAYELLILDQDEQRQPLSPGFRQGQLRQLLPEVLVALADPRERVVLRLDGPLRRGELVQAFHYLTDPDG